ncbi:MAG: CRTAC1 family protein [Planctomycetota bacterium]
MQKTPLAGALITMAAAFATAAPFTERASEAGCVHLHATASQFSDMEFMCAGGVAVDIDRDGDQDLFIIGGSNGFDRLYRNEGDGTFTDISLSAEIDRAHRGSGASAADYDNDGDLDIYVTSIGSSQSQIAGTNILYRNNGDNTFTDVAQAAGVRFTNASQGDAYGSAFGDYDLDGDLDLAVAGWLGGNRLFRNNGDGTFTNVTNQALPSDMDDVRGFAPRFLDMDGDRYPELLWVADFFTSRYLINNTDGSFTDATASSGTGLDSNGMGNAYADFDNDGDYDWYVTSRINFSGGGGSGNMLYKQGPTPHVFSEVSVATGVNFGYWGWGTDAQDFDHDADVDIIATNGFDSSFVNDPTVFFINDGTGNFTESAAAFGLQDTMQGRGLLTADLDNDGDRDIVIFNNRQPMLLYQNETPNPGSTAITIAVDTAGIGSVAPDGFGTLVTATTGAVTQRRTIDGGSNYLAQSELSAHFGLGTAAGATISLTYADGVTDTFPNVAPGRHTITRLACPADFNRDASLNFFDLVEFLNRFGEAHPMGDFDRNGAFNFFDIAGYIGAFNAGCP